MKIEPNYLYRVLPRLESVGQVERQGGGWHATDPGSSINGAVSSRREVLAEVLGSVRLEHLEPSPEMLAVLERWAEGTLSDDELGEFAARAAAGKALMPETSSQID